MKTIGKLTALLPAGAIAAAMLVGCGGGSDAASSAVAATAKPTLEQPRASVKGPIFCYWCIFRIETLEYFAGSVYDLGNNNGAGTTATFFLPEGLATDSAGNLYVADTGNNDIRKITPAGIVSTLAGTGSVAGFANGSGAAASFNHPGGVATDSAGNVYVADAGNNSIREITPAGEVSTLAGTGAQGAVDGAGIDASFFYPGGVATDSAGNVYVADTNNNLIRKIIPGHLVTPTFGVPTDVITLAGAAGQSGSADGTGGNARFYSPEAIATDASGNVYVADTFNSAIRKITPDGVVSTFAGVAGVAGSADGTGAEARFAFPNGIATDSSGNVYVADSANFTVRMITPAGVVTTLVGVEGKPGFVAGVLPGGLVQPYGVTFNGSNLYITTGDAVAVADNL